MSMSKFFEELGKYILSLIILPIICVMVALQILLAIVTLPICFIDCHFGCNFSESVLNKVFEICGLKETN